MTASVLDRHVQAARRALVQHMGAQVIDEWTVEAPHARAQVMSMAQAIADAEERGRMEERARCLALAMSRAPKWIHWIRDGVKDGHEPPPAWLDAARKELGE